MVRTTARIAVVAAGLIALPACSMAVIVIDNAGNATRNITAPGGALTDSGWQLQGDWGGFLGTPIAPDYFIAARHVGGSVGQTFTFGAASYTTTARYDSPDSDLTIWKISGSFPTWASLYLDSDEFGKGAVIFGRGTQPGAQVTVGATPKGWRWGSGDGQRSWGQNVVSGAPVDSTYGRLLAMDFDYVTGVNEGGLSTGDSSGGVFIQDGSAWKLAGINLAVDGPYKLSPDDAASFNASLYDQSGLYIENPPGQWVPAPAGPGASYATSISGNLAWIGSIVPSAVPEPATLALLAGTAFLLLKRPR